MIFVAGWFVGRLPKILVSVLPIEFIDVLTIAQYADYAVHVLIVALCAAFILFSRRGPHHKKASAADENGLKMR